MQLELDFILFEKADFPEYLSWYKDPDLNKQLGPMEENDEWLSTLDNEEGCTYSVFQHKKLVAVIGIVFPDTDYPHYCITNIAIKPTLRSKGIGKKVVEKIMQLHQPKKGQSWIAHVDEKNPRAKLFFENNGWKCTTLPAKNNGMFMFEYGF